MNSVAQAFAGPWSSAWRRTGTADTTSMPFLMIRAGHFNGETAVLVACDQEASGLGIQDRRHVNIPFTGIGSVLCVRARTAGVTAAPWTARTPWSVPRSISLRFSADARTMIPLMILQTSRPTNHTQRRRPFQSPSANQP